MSDIVPASKSDIRVAIVDDHAITRRALNEFLSGHDGIRIVGMGATGREALELARKVEMDVMLLDIDMPVQTGIDALPRIAGRTNAPAVIVFSAHPSASYGVAVLRKGASGYLDKQCEPEEIVKAIKTVSSGRKYLNAEISSLLLDDVSRPVGAAPHSKLTDREFQIFLRLAKGQACADVARDLSLSPKTVSTYRVIVMSKVQARTNSDLTYYAIKHNLIS